MWARLTVRIQVIFSLGAAALLVPSVAAALPGWTLVWSDEFSQPDGSAPDGSRWGYDVGGGGWGNNELENYTTRTNNARVENGQLVIEARQESYGGRNYTSARLLTKGKWSWTCVRVEARMKLPRGQGIWPAFWMLGTNIDSVGWPACGEIDIMENIGREPGTVHGTIHGPGYSGGGSIGGPYALPGGAAFADDFHVFAIEWETNRIRWFADGQPYFSATPASLPSGAQWAFNKPEFLIMNLAVGGNWPGNPDGTTVFPQRLVVDYVRVYAATNSTGCAGNVLTNPGFEPGGLANWTTYGAGFNTQIANAPSLPVHSGTNAFKVFGQFTGVDNYSGIYQDIPCGPGATYSGRGWAITPAGDQIAAGNTAWIEVAFRDATTNTLALFRTAMVTNSTPAGVWLNLAVTNQLDPATYATMGSVTNLLAPAGTAFVRYQVVFRQPQNAAGAVIFDDLSLSVPGLSSVPATSSAARNGAGLALSFATFFGLPYQVRYKSDLGEANWQALTNVVGEGRRQSVTDSLGPSSRFYRVDCACN